MVLILSNRATTSLIEFITWVFPHLRLILWKGIVPPKFNVFIWILLHGRSCTKDFIARRHLMHLEEAICPFCAEEIYRICGSSFSTLFCGLEIVEPLIWFGLTMMYGKNIKELFFEWYFLVKGKI